MNRLISVPMPQFSTTTVIDGVTYVLMEPAVLRKALSALTEPEWGEAEPAGYVSSTTMAYLTGHVAHVACSIYAEPVSIHTIPLYASQPSPAEVTDEMVERGLDAPVVGDCTAIEYLDFTSSDAKELGVHIEGENFAKLSDIRHQQWRDAGRAIVRRILTASLQLGKEG